MYCSSLSVIIMNNMPTGMKKHCKSTEPESCQTAKMFFHLSSSSSSSSSDWLVHNYVTLSQWFSHKTASIYIEQCTSLSLFHNFEVSGDSLNWTLKNYGFISDAIFNLKLTHSQKSLSNETIIIQYC